ncbi:hypothetical protein F5887DRAFT_1161415 [Amanita rubescens]|nr:hypothetical protein F5887DRAFT_1161415 [Amanita rubescens]
MYHNAPETTPSEILCEIFQLLRDEPISLHVLDNSSCFGGFPWAVGQVCKRWRDVFLSYPHLWTSLSLRYRSSDIVGVDRLHEISRRTLLYLERSERLPLTITVHSTYGGSFESFPRTTWKLLLSCSERWERADLTLRHEPPLLDLLRCKMPIIKSLGLHADVYAPHFDLYHSFTALPRLVELDIFGRLRESWVFPWSQLTKVNISVTYGDSKKLGTILSQLRNVEELRMGKAIIRRRYNAPDRCPSPIRLASLRLLAVPIHPPEILTWLEAPLLEHLWLDWCLIQGQDPERYSLIFTEELSFFIHRSSCHIRRLTLHNCEWLLFPSLMKLLSSVEVLCIKTIVSSCSSLLAELFTQMGGVYPPNLREMEVICPRGRDDEKLVTATSLLLETQRAESRLISASLGDVPLEPTMDDGFLIRKNELR